MAVNVDVTDIYGIEHKNCELVLCENEYQRTFIFQDEIGHRFMGLKENPEVIKGYRPSMHWDKPNMNEIPKSYLENISE